MVSKTRKRKQQKGGAIHKLPSEVAPTTGAKPATLIENFFTKNNLYYVDGHGAILDSTYTVPANTYIFHAGISGKSLFSEYCDIEGKFLGENDILDLVQKENRDDLWRLLTGQSNVSSVKMYSPKKFEPEEVSLAIYEPGDEVHDMIFKFSNEGPSYLSVRMNGVYKVPIKETLLTLIEKAQVDKLKKIDDYRKSTAGKKNSDTEKEKKETAISTQFAKENDDIFRKNKNNLLKQYFERDLSKAEESSRNTITESTIVSDEAVFPAPADGVRIFIVWACRAPYNASTEEERVTKAKTMRRRSLNVRKYNEGAREAFMKAEEDKKSKNRLTKFIKNLESGKTINMDHFEAMRKQALKFAEERNDKLLQEALEEVFGKN